MELILPPGTTSKQSHDSQAPEAGPIRFRFAEMAEDWVFFNHGAFFRYAGMSDPDEDPVNDWIKEQPRHIRVLKHACDHTVFGELYAPTKVGPHQSLWSHVICAVPQPVWPSLRDFLGGVCIINRRKRKLWRAFHGDAEIPDPLAEDRQVEGPLANIRVTVFGVEDGSERWELVYGLAPGSRPFFRRAVPDPASAEAEKAFFQGNINPLVKHATAGLEDIDREHAKLTQRAGPRIELP